MAGPAAVKFRQLSVGREAHCGVTDAGAMHCWGNDWLNLISDAPEGTQWAAVSVNDHHACALEHRGGVFCWGRSDLGQTTPPAGVAFAEVAVGRRHSCGRGRDGGLHCWGYNPDGRANSHPGPFSALAVGPEGACATYRDGGGAFCQGRNRLKAPETVFTQIAVGHDYACGLTAERSAECWNGGGRLAVPPGQFRAISAGYSAVCGLTAEGPAECWDYAFDAAGRFSGRFLDKPVDLLAWPEGGWATAGRRGVIGLHRPETPPRLLLDLSGATLCCDGSFGALSIALDPQFAFLYVWHIRKPPGGPGGWPAARLSRFPAGGGRVNAAAELVILELPLLQPEAAQHFGGELAFGPDGMLYLGLGDNEHPPESQNRASLWGAIIRIDVRGATIEQPYRIPPDNPLLDTPGARPEIWAYGLRNPWRMSFDSLGRLWVGDVGKHRWEEASIASSGANLGWPVFEGRRCNAGKPECAALPEAVPPVFDYTHAEGCAIIWGGEYRGRALPQLRGTPLFSDYCSGKVWALESHPETGWQKREIAKFSGLLNSFGADAAGEMHLLLVDGAIISLAQLIPAELAEP